MTQPLPAAPPAPFNRTIFAVWDQGLHKAPKLVRHTLDRWQALNPGWALRVFDREERLARMPDMPGKAGLPVQQGTDILRTHLMATVGGVWTDASVLPMEPLDSWLRPRIAEGRPFAFVYPDRTRPLSSWFLASWPDEPLFVILRDALVEYFSTPRRLVRPVPPTVPARLASYVAPRLRFARTVAADPQYALSPQGRRAPYHPYYAWHYMLAHLAETDARVRTRMDVIDPVPAVLPQALMTAYRSTPPDVLERSLDTLLAQSPVHKLNWRKPWPDRLYTGTGAGQTP